MSSDVNETHLGFLALDARPDVIVGPPAQAAPADLSGRSAVIVSGAAAPPGAWTRAWQGRGLSLWTPTP
jgi:hypothetical protein